MEVAQLERGGRPSGLRLLAMSGTNGVEGRGEYAGVVEGKHCS